MALQVASHTFAPIAQTSLSPTPPSTTGHIVAAPTTQQADTVKLSLSARIHQLKSQGQNAKQIAGNLGVAAADVSTYFASTTSKQTATPAPAPDVETHAAASVVAAAASASSK